MAGCPSTYYNTTTPQQDILLSSPHKETRGEAAVLLKYIQRKQQDQSLHKTPSIEASVDTRGYTGIGHCPQHPNGTSTVKESKLARPHVAELCEIVIQKTSPSWPLNVSMRWKPRVKLPGLGLCTLSLRRAGLTWIRALEATAPSPWSPLNSSPNQRRKLGLNAPDSPNTTGTYSHKFYVVSASQEKNGQMKIMARSFGGNGKETMVKFYALWLFSCQIFSTICSW